MSFVRGLSKNARSSGAPAVYILIGVLLAAFVVAWLVQGSIFPHLAFTGNWAKPWTLLTYPFADVGDGTSLLWFLLMLMWLYWVGTAVERDLQTIKFVGFLLAMTLLPALLIYVGGMVINNKPPAVYGPSLLVSAITVAWGVRYPTTCIRLWCIIPVTGKILAVLTVLLTMFGYGTIYGSPAMGVIASLHLGVAAAFAANKLPFAGYHKPAWKSPAAKATDRRDAAYYDDVKRREQERVERERLRKLFEGSVRDDAGNDR
jgi:hypothetical protein